MSKYQICEDLLEICPPLPSFRAQILKKYEKNMKVYEGDVKKFVHFSFFPTIQIINIEIKMFHVFSLGYTPLNVEFATPPPPTEGSEFFHVPRPMYERAFLHIS